MAAGLPRGGCQCYLRLIVIWLFLNLILFFCKKKKGRKVWQTHPKGGGLGSIGRDAVMLLLASGNTAVATIVVRKI
jgi:hypothetical protein